MSKYWIAFDEQGNLTMTGMEYQPEDPNEGIPMIAFEEKWLPMLVDDEEKTVEWVPGTGPAPIWKGVLEEPKIIWSKFYQWYIKTYL